MRIQLTLRKRQPVISRILVEKYLQKQLLEDLSYVFEFKETTLKLIC